MYPVVDYTLLASVLLFWWMTIQNFQEVDVKLDIDKFITWLSDFDHVRPTLNFMYVVLIGFSKLQFLVVLGLWVGCGGGAEENGNKSWKVGSIALSGVQKHFFVLW